MTRWRKTPCSARVMTTKKITNSTPPAAAGKVASKRAAPKAPRTRGKPQKPDTSTGSLFAPELLADLAVKLVRLKMDASSTGSRSKPQLASRAFDADFADALKRAEMLLLMASGRSDEDVHAYQLFTEEDGRMSFEEIARRFSDAGWELMKSQNTVKPIIVELVTAAEHEVQKELDRHEHLVTVRSRYPGGVYHLVDRVKRHIRGMINRTQLRFLFDNPAEVADWMGRSFLRLMEGKIRGDWERDLQEELIAADGFRSFIKHVCCGLSYERFVGDPPQVWMDLNRLGSLIHFLANLGTKDPAALRKSASDLESLMRLTNRRNDVPAEAFKDLDACMGELRRPDPDAARVRESADGAARSLRELWERWNLIQLARALDLGMLIRDLVGRYDEFGGTDHSIASKVEQALLHLQKGTDHSIADKVEQALLLLPRVDEVGRGREQAMTVCEIRGLLSELSQCLEAVALLPSSEATSYGGDRTIAVELTSVAGGLKRGLQAKAPAKRHAQDALNDLLQELKPYSGERKCRPYEIFLFAAEKRLRQDKLVRGRLRLKRGFIPYPPYPSTLSILGTHKGAEITQAPDES